MCPYTKGDAELPSLHAVQEHSASNRKKKKNSIFCGLLPIEQVYYNCCISDRSRDTADFVTRDTAYFVTRNTAGFVTRDTAGFVTRDTAGFVTRDTAGFVTRDTAGFITRDVQNP